MMTPKRVPLPTETYKRAAISAALEGIPVAAYVARAVEASMAAPTEESIADLEARMRISGEAADKWAAAVAKTTAVAK